MFNKLKSLCIISTLFFLVIGCYPVSHIIVGEQKAPIDYFNVKVYPDFPEGYSKIAILESSSEIAFKDFSIPITHQQKTNKSLKRLKKEAASLGANGIVILSLSTARKPLLNVSEQNLSLRNENIKEIRAIAISVE